MIKMPIIIIPLNRYKAYWKIVVKDNDGNSHTVLESNNSSTLNNKTLSASFTRTATDSLGTFDITLSNNQGEFLRKFDGGEEVKFYLDFVDATTLVFAGKIDNIKYGLSSSTGWTLTLNGRDYPSIADDLTIIQFDNKDAITCLKGGTIYGELQDSEGNWNDGILYGTGLNWDPINISSSTENITNSYQNKSYFEIIKDICNQAKLDCYIYYNESDSKWYIKVFQENTIQNDTETITYGVNLTSIGEFGTNNDDVRNKITVYGKSDSNIISIKTKEDLVSQANLWKKAEVITDSNLSVIGELTSKAISELSIKSTPIETGRMTSLVLPTLNPGENIKVVVPFCNIDGWYNVKSFTTDFSPGGSFTSVNLTKKIIKLSDIFDKFDIEGNVTSYNNLNGMTNSLNLTFEDDEDSWLDLVDCSTLESVLRLDTGKTTGTCTSKAVATVIAGAADDNITQCELRIKANNYNNCTYEVSNDDGNTWNSITPGVLLDFPNNGSSLRVKITLNVLDSVSPEFDGVCVLYR